MILETTILKRVLQGKIMHLDEKERHAKGAGKPDLAATYSNQRAGLFTALKTIEAQEDKSKKLSKTVKEEALKQLTDWMDESGVSYNQSAAFEQKCPIIWNLINPESE